MSLMTPLADALPYQLSVEATLEQYRTSPTGLPTDAAVASLERDGANALELAHGVSPWRLWVDQLADWMIAMLLVSAAIAAYLGDPRTAIVLVALVLFNTVIGFVQEYRAERTMEALQRLVKPVAQVYRDGRLTELPSAGLVVGDVVRLAEGDLVPADVRLIEMSGFATNDFALTGESDPTRKFTHRIAGSVPMANRHNLAYMGTTVATGEAFGVVVATGMRTELGRIAHLSQSTQRDQSPLQREIRHIATLVTYGVTGLALVLLVIAMASNLPFKDALLFAVGFASALIPQGLPAEVNTSLAQAAGKLARHNALVRRLSAVESLGATQVICTDKTGTLTRNEMTVIGAVVDGVEYRLTGTGYGPEGEVLLEETVLAPHDAAHIRDFFRIGLLASNARVLPPMAKLTKALAVSAASVLVLTACSSGTAATTASSGQAGGQLPATTIKILAPSYGDSSQADWQKIITDFKTKQPNVTVELQIEAWDNFTDKVKARIQAKDYPDILNDNAFASEAAAGLLYPINEVMSEATLKSIEPALLKNGLGVDGKQWAAPDIASARLMATNTDLLKKAGISSAPKTWADLEAAATKVAGTGVSGYGMPLGSEEAQVEASLWLWGAGGDWPQGDKLVANQPAAVEAFAQMKKLIDAKATQPDPGATNRQAVADLFNNSKLGMYVTHSGLMSVTREKFPDVKYELSQIPSKDGSPVAFGVTDFILAFNNNDANRKQATKEFLDLFYSDAMYEGWYKGTGLLPVTTSMISAAKTSDTANAKFYEALSYVKFLPVSNPQWDALKNALQGTAGTIAKDTPENVLSKIQAQVDAQS